MVTILLGNSIVLVPMILNAHAGTKYGVSFPVLCRASFGVKGANVPAMPRTSRRANVVLFLIVFSLCLPVARNAPGGLRSGHALVGFLAGVAVMYATGVLAG